MNILVKFYTILDNFNVSQLGAVEQAYITAQTKLNEIRKLI